MVVSKKSLALIAFVVVVMGLILLVESPIVRQDIPDAGAYALEVRGTISEINSSDETLVIIASKPYLSYNTGDPLKISFRPTLWDSFFSGETAATIGSRVSILLFPVGSDETDLVGMSIELL